MVFPKNFAWGAATASYQIEGAALEDGKKMSVWDLFCEKPGNVWQGHTGAVACDHYHRYAGDVAIMKAMGLRAYRFSIAWARVLPDGVGAVNRKGLDFYDRLVDALLAAGIEPYVTLFHWDYPYELYKRGGWLNPQSSEWFREYTAVVVKRLSDRVTRWMTLNEPQCFVHFGHQTGEHAPGLKLGLRDVLAAAHNVLLAHGKSVMAVREHAARRCQVGFAPVGFVRIPARNTPRDIRAAREAMFAMTRPGTWNNTWWLDPVFLGRYPEDGLRLHAGHMPRFPRSDLQTICQPLDFFGANIYVGEGVAAGRDGRAVPCPTPDGHPLTGYDWWVTPACLYWGPRFYYERHKLPVMITENGLSVRDWISLDGAVHDPLRIDFLNRYLLELHRAIRDGARVTGYFQWSLLDNFEWHQGFKERFGLVHVDYATQKRTVKDSGHWYRQVIRSNGRSLSRRPRRTARA